MNGVIELNEKQIAKETLSALSRLRQGCNPFDIKKLQHFTTDEMVFKRNCNLLGIPECYDNTMFNALRKMIS